MRLMRSPWGLFRFPAAVTGLVDTKCLGIPVAVKAVTCSPCLSLRRAPHSCCRAARCPRQHSLRPLMLTAINLTAATAALAEPEEVVLTVLTPSTLSRAPDLLPWFLLSKASSGLRFKHTAGGPTWRHAEKQSSLCHFPAPRV